MTINFGDVLTFKATITDEKNNLMIGINNHLIKLLNPRGTIIQTTEDYTELGRGVYETKITLPISGAGGIWTLIWQIGEESEKYRFRVKP